MTNYNELFNELARTPSLKKKESLLEEYIGDTTLVTILKLTLDPNTQFYIIKIPAYAQKEDFFISFEQALDCLLRLSRREITGKKAVEYLSDTLACLSYDDAKVVERIIQRDLRCGVSSGIVNRVWPNLIREFPCMLVSSYDEKKVNSFEYPAITDCKADEIRCMAIIIDEEVELYSRSGKLLLTLGVIEDAFKKLMMTYFQGKNYVIDGELLVFGDDGKPLPRKKSNGILLKAQKGTLTYAEALMIRFIMWDAIDNSHNQFVNGFCVIPYKERLKVVENAHIVTEGLIRHIESKVVNSIEEAQAFYLQMLAEGKEGIVLKSKDAPWENTRVKHQIKFKQELECELIVTGLQEGTGKYLGKLGAFLAESSDGLLKVAIGSGLTDAQRKEFFSNDLVGSIITVKYNGKITNCKEEVSLFLPIFIEIRTDKASANTFSEIL